MSAQTVHRIETNASTVTLLTTVRYLSLLGWRIRFGPKLVSEREGTRKGVTLPPERRPVDTPVRAATPWRTTWKRPPWHPQPDAPTPSP